MKSWVGFGGSKSANLAGVLREFLARNHKLQFQKTKTLYIFVCVSGSLVLFLAHARGDSHPFLIFSPLQGCPDCGFVLQWRTERKFTEKIRGVARPTDFLPHFFTCTRKVNFRDAGCAWDCTILGTADHATQGISGTLLVPFGVSSI